MAEETDKIVCFDERPHSFNLPDTDFKAEVVASGLKESGYDAERTLISRLGDIRRGFSKDIHDAHSEYSQYDLTDYLYLYVNRRSIYDTLPEGIFHKNLYQSDKSSKEQILDEIRIHTRCGQLRSDPDHDQHHERIQDLLSDIRDLKCPSHCLIH